MTAATDAAFGYAARPIYLAFGHIYCEPEPSVISPQHADESCDVIVVMKTHLEAGISAYAPGGHSE